MTKKSDKTALPPPIVVSCQGNSLESLLEKEWLLTNEIGAYASSTVIGSNSRRYHGLLVAATAPPVRRIATLSTVMEHLAVGGKTYELATNEFEGAFSPYGIDYLAEFRNDVAPTFIYRVGGAELVKEIILAEAVNAVALRYTLRGADATLRLAPFAALRDYHSLRSAAEPHQMTFQTVNGGVEVRDGAAPTNALFIISNEAQFEPSPQWWYRFRYRIDLARGQDGFEDLYTPGSFIYKLKAGQTCQITASLNDPLPLGFATTVRRRRAKLASLAAGIENDDETTRRLSVSTEAFVAQRSFPNLQPSATILAGYHWFADWGRDAFIALPGLLLTTGLFEKAREVFRTFASRMSSGMVPNRFDDYRAAAHYNSIDASLWFIIAAERYLATTEDWNFWREVLMPASQRILTAYQGGTSFDIRADADVLLTGGSASTQLTWMDAASGDGPVTSRYGKAVEVNALWHSAHAIMAERCRGIDDSLVETCTHQAALIAPAFVSAFWNAKENCLHDCITDGRADASIRPNQIFAVSLPHSPLSGQQQLAVVQKVAEELLTPMGLRTLSPKDKGYCPRYEGSPLSRDRAYHQGTVWAWLMGPFIEAYLKVREDKLAAVAQARRWLEEFNAHLYEAGLGFVSEIFDAEPPHRPGGCIAQAWSVAEILRARKLLQTFSKEATSTI